MLLHIEMQEFNK